MSFTIEYVENVTFERCFGWPKPVDQNNVPENTIILVVVNGHVEPNSFFNEIKLDNFTGYVRIEFDQSRLTGHSEEREEKKSAIEENQKKILDVFLSL